MQLKNIRPGQILWIVPTDYLNPPRKQCLVEVGGRGKGRLAIEYSLHPDKLVYGWTGPAGYILYVRYHGASEWGWFPAHELELIEICRTSNIK